MFATKLKNTCVNFRIHQLLRTKDNIRKQSQHASASLHALQSSKSRYFICDNAGSVARACDILNAVPYVLFDCEGHNARAPDGSEQVSLVQMGTPHAEDVFLFDMLALQKCRHTIVNVLSLICNPRLLKIGWGGVEDFAAVLRVYKQPIMTFLDLQLIDIHSRLRRREPRENQISRLASRVFPASAIAKLQIDGVHRLSRMDEALIEHGVTDTPLKERHTSRWSDRPLSGSDIRYAANDIVRISQLHNHFRSSNILSVKLLTDSIAQTTVLSELHGPTGALNVRKHFIQSNILPLGIINISVTDSSFFTSNLDLRKCRRCHRALTPDCFSYTPDAGAADGNRMIICRVCLFFLEKQRYIMRNAAKTANKYAKKLNL